jgi:hypothetical protein
MPLRGGSVGGAAVGGGAELGGEALRAAGEQRHVGADAFTPTGYPAVRTASNARSTAAATSGCVC